MDGRREWIATAGGALRTFQRRVKLWRELNGPPKEMYFPQMREPGKSLQFDWTRVKQKDFTITIAGEPFVHLLAHAVLPYSNWEWAIPCRSESSLSLKRGVQEALWELGGTTPVVADGSKFSRHTSDHPRGKKRTFNEEYLAFCQHSRSSHGRSPRSPDQNGDVESAQAHLKSRLKNHLDPAGIARLQGRGGVRRLCREGVWRGERAAGREARRGGALLKPLPSRRYPASDEVTALVTGASVSPCRRRRPTRCPRA